MTAPSGAAFIDDMDGGADVPVPSYDEDPDESFIGPDIAEFFNEEEQYEDYDSLELSIAQSGYPEEEPQMDILRDYTHEGKQEL